VPPPLRTDDPDLRTQRSDARRLGGWAGIAGSVLFVTVLTIEGWARPGYEPASMFISALSLGPRGWIQIANFILLGALFLVFAGGVAAEFRSGTASRGATLLRIIGVSFLASGPFVMDPAGVPWELMSWHSRIHYLFGAVVFSLGPVSCFVFYRRFRGDPTWRSLRWPTLGAGLMMSLAVVLLKVLPARAPAPPNTWNHWVGAIQRLALLPYMAWVLAFGLALLGRSRVGGDGGKRAG
jgi:hypothetical protein